MARIAHARVGSQVERTTQTRHLRLVSSRPTAASGPKQRPMLYPLPPEPAESVARILLDAEGSRLVGATIMAAARAMREDLAG